MMREEYGEDKCQGNYVPQGDDLRGIENFGREEENTSAYENSRIQST